MESTINMIKEKLHDAGDSIGEIQNVGNAERLVSVLAGIAMTYYGLQKNETLLGKGLTFVGGLLLTRGQQAFVLLTKP